MDDSNRPNEPTDDVANLVRLAGESSVSRERMERARVVAKQQWREQTRRRSRKHLVWSVAAVAAVLGTVAILVGVLDFDPRIEVASIETLSGDVTLRGPSGSTRPAVGESVPMDAILETGTDGTAALRLPTGHSLRIDRESSLELRGNQTLALVAGALYVESDPDLPAQAIDVHTPFGLVRETGTQFELRLRQRGLRIRLREGSVRLEHAGADHTVEAGNELQVDESGQTRERKIAIHGDEWAWVHAVAPLPRLEGRSAHSFLTWVAREKGWSLAFDNEGALRTAQTAIVQGQLEQLSPQQALDAVLPASRLDYRIVDGSLIVSAQP